jgi:O-antigen/teichoic acid export membrane protein
MMLVASIAVPINSYFLAEGKPNAPVLAVGAELAVGFLLVAALVSNFNEAGVGVAMSVGTVVSVAILLASTQPLVRGGVGKVVRITAISFLAAAAGQLIPAPYDAVGMLAALSVSGVVWLLLATVLVRDETTRVVGMIRAMKARTAR